MKLVFVTFADNKFLGSLKRIESEAEKFNSITDLCIFHQEDIDSNYFKIIRPKKYRRGYGYWRWKSYFANKVFRTLSDGDVMIWADAGCNLNYRNEAQLLDWVDMATKTESGIVAFSQVGLLESQWTKGDLFNYLEVDDKTRNSPQLWAGTWIAIKTKISSQLFEQWFAICRDRGDLVMDVKSKIPNEKGFIEHRHDQSVFSLLVKTTDAIVIPYIKDDETNYPIIASRMKTKSRYVDVRGKFLLPWRLLIGLYLKYHEDFYFKDRVAW